MGYKTEIIIGQSKHQAITSAVGSGAVTSPPSRGIAIVSMLDASNSHRENEVKNTLIDLINYVRENNLYQGNGLGIFKTTLEGGRNGIVQDDIASQIVTGEVAIMVNGVLMDLGENTTVIESRFKQLIDVARERGQLA